MKFKEIIKEAYESNSYIETFRSREVTDFERSIFDQVIDLAPGKEILDLGCGNGYPYDRYFVDNGFALTGVDFSERFIEQAHDINPSATYVVSDMESYEPLRSYDVVMALYSIMHVPRDNQERLFKKIYETLSPNGVFLLTTSNKPAGDVTQRDDFCGAEMLWSYFDYETYIAMLDRIGLRLVSTDNDIQHGGTENIDWSIFQKSS